MATIQCFVSGEISSFVFKLACSLLQFYKERISEVLWCCCCNIGQLVTWLFVYSGHTGVVPYHLLLIVCLHPTIQIISSMSTCDRVLNRLSGPCSHAFWPDLRLMPSTAWGLIALNVIAAYWFPRTPLLVQFPLKSRCTVLRHIGLVLQRLDFLLHSIQRAPTGHFCSFLCQLS